MVHSDHASILHRYGDMKPQTLDGRTTDAVQCYCIALDRQKIQQFVLKRF